MMFIPRKSRKVSHLRDFAVLSMILAVIGVGLHCSINLGQMTAEEKRVAIDGMYEDYRKGFPDLPEVEIVDLAESLEAGNVVLVDVREPREYEVSRIPGAITRSEFEREKSSYKDRPIVLYCTIGYRSGQFAKELRDEGFDASNLRGSILSWAHEGQPLVNDAGETTRVHVYGPQWDLLPDGYESVW